MVNPSLKTLIAAFVVFIMIVPVGMGAVSASDESESSTDYGSETSSSRAGLERGAVEGKEKQTGELPDIIRSDFTKLNLESSADMSMEGTSLTFLGKNPNQALKFMSGFPQQQESRSSRAEPADNTPAGANPLTAGMPVRKDTLGSGGDTQDWYSIALTVDIYKHDQVEIVVFNNETQAGKNLTVVFFDNFNGYPLVCNEYRGYNTPQGTITMGGVQPNKTFTVKARAPTTGTYYMAVAPGITGTYNYEILSVSVAKVDPMDQNNHWTQASKEVSKNFMGGLYQGVNHWNWHNVSSHFVNTGPDWENNLSYTITVTTEASGEIQELKPVGNFIWLSWTMVSIIYNDQNNDYYLRHHLIYTGGSSNARIGNNVLNPRGGWAIINGSFAYIGVEVMSAFFYIDTSNEVHVDRWSTTGSSQYSVQINVEEIDLNHKPQLNFGGVTPKKGKITENYTFEVKFTDLNNEPPQNIKVIVDNDPLKTFDMTKKTGESSNYDQGVVFEAFVKGEAIGDDPYPHSYRFVADDGRKDAHGDISDHTDLFIYANENPIIHPNAPTQYVMNEDEDPALINLYDLFYDPDGDTDIMHDLDGHTLDFTVRDFDDTEWGTKYKNDFVDITLLDIDDTTKIRIKPLRDQYGECTIRLKATDESVYGDDEYTEEIESTLDIIVNPINDAPVLEPIPDFITGGDKSALKEDTPWEIDFNATDPDLGTVLYFSTDIEEVLLVDGQRVLKSDPQDYGYSWDPFLGRLTLTPSNDFVGEYTIHVTVEDQGLAMRSGYAQSLSDSQDFKIQILTVNDKPELISVGNKDVIEGTMLTFEATQNKELRLEIEAKDPDIDIGENDFLKYRMSLEPQENLEIDELKGIFKFTPNQDDVDKRVISFNLTVVDSHNAQDKVDVRIRINNVNDPPFVEEVEPVPVGDLDESTAEKETYTFTYRIINPSDPDGNVESLTYTWDFDITENHDNSGTADDDIEEQGSENIEHTYPKAGTYVGVLTVRDSFGAVFKINFTVEVIPPKDIDLPTEDDKSKGDDDKGLIGLGTLGGVDAAYWISIIIIVIIVTLLVVFFVIRKKREEIEKMRHAERFKDETMGDEEGRVEMREGMGEGGFGAATPMGESQAPASLYGDLGGGSPGLFGPTPAGLPPAGQPIAPVGMQPMGGPAPFQQPLQQQPLSLPPAAVVTQQQPKPAQPEPSPAAAGGTSDMKCTSCNTPINPEWFICPGCHRFLK
ncbi:MAG: hypothetical protein JSV49_07595 [Thermoplasmata archaeon]|nr:MAG: hypothetical protein JSV49_07595 [Thermoplasmata archaeon]